MARGFSYDELSEEEKRGRKHKNKVVLEAERQAKVALDKVEKYAVLATIDKKELTIPLLNIKAPVQEAMNAVNKELAIPIPTLITRVRDNILKSKEQKNIQPTKGGHKLVTCQNYVSLFYRQITSCPSDGGIS